MGKSAPIHLTRFIGRERELARIKRLLADTRLLTLTGPGGSGKTRLALEVLGQLQDTTDAFRAWVDLASISEEALVPQAVAKALGVAEQPDRTAGEAVAAYLKDKKYLLVLDNCEHLINACAQLVHQLLPACPDLRVLATSRESLALSGETIYRVPALSYPQADALAALRKSQTLSPGDLEDLAGYESVALFLNRAAAIRPEFALTPENARAIALICHRLDGMPLAIELAAARVNVLTVDQIAGRLNDHFALLVSGDRDSVARHQSLRATFDWSHDLLSAAEKKLLRRLSVFAGGCSLKTAEAVCSGDGVERDQLLSLLASLVDKSLVIAETVRSSEARYSLLEVIRQYAADKLHASGERAAVRQRHLRCFLQLVEESEPKLRGQYQQLWLNWLESEIDNIRVALSWALDTGQIEAGLRITSAIYLLWAVRGYVEEGSSWLEQLLARADDGIPPAVRANALASAAFLAVFRKDVAAQMKYGREAAHIAESVDHVGKSALVWALFAQAAGASAAGDYEAEYSLSGRIIQLTRELGDTYLLAVALASSSTAAMNVGKYAEARDRLEEALPLLHKSRDSHRIGMTLNVLGDLERCQQNYVQAQQYYEASLSRLQEVNAERDLASVLHNLGHACLHCGDLERAHSLFNQSITMHQEQQNEPGTAECLIGFAAVAISSGRPAAGARLLAAASAIGGESLIAPWPATRMEYNHYLAQAEDQLSSQAFLNERRLGRALSLDDAVAQAQEVGRRVITARKRTSQLDQLTPREREVATLIAQAKTNGEIAEALVVSKRTVESHIANIRSKFGFTERTQIVRWAIKTGLVGVGEQERS